MGIFSDLFSGNFSGVVDDIEKSFAKLPAPVQSFIAKIESDAESLLMSLATIGIADVAAGGFSTASFVTAGKDIVAKASSQGQTILMSEAMAALNIMAPTAAAPAVI